MFRRRTMIVVGIMLGGFAIVLLRLAELQVVNADLYRQQAADALLLPSKTIPFVRGSILDRTGRVLASDVPSWEIRLDYGVLSADEG